MCLISLSPNIGDTIDPNKNINFAISGLMNINIPPQINIEINANIINEFNFCFIFFSINTSPFYSLNLYINYTLFRRILK